MKDFWEQVIYAAMVVFVVALVVLGGLVITTAVFALFLWALRVVT